MDQFIKEKVESAYHPCGTLRMGTDRKAVVDPRTMKLKDFDGLFVGDSSVMPQATAGDLNTPTLMIAERAADLIKGEVLSEDVLAPIMGDFNWDVLNHNSNNHVTKYIDTFMCNGFVPLISKPTHFKGGSSTCIDQMWTNVISDKAF